MASTTTVFITGVARGKYSSCKPTLPQCMTNDSQSQSQALAKHYFQATSSAQITSSLAAFVTPPPQRPRSSKLFQPRRALVSISLVSRPLHLQILRKLLRRSKQQVSARSTSLSPTPASPRPQHFRIPSTLRMSSTASMWTQWDRLFSTRLWSH